MKKKKILFDTLMFLPLLATLVALPFLPEQIPAHYGFDNQVTRWGSKYEALAYPAATVCMGLFFIAMAKWTARQEKDGHNNENVLFAAGCATLLMFNVMNLYALYTDFCRIENLSAVSPDIYRVFAGLLGVFMVVTGNVMPKLRKNSMIGLRTKWSMQDEETWKKCQRFGGISFLFGGVAILLLCVWTKGISCFAGAMGVVAVLLVVDIIYTYQAAKSERK